MISWKCKHTWKKSAVNTAWCLLGCSIGDFGTIFVFQMIEHSWSVWQVMSLAIINGLLTSIALETFIFMPIMLLAGFLTPWPYNYWRLKKYNASCH